ncbi:conjugative coupling factor TraD, SXT/TOL subfamily, traD [Pediococcus pentosaceus]
MITALFVLSFLSGISLLIGEQAWQVILRLKDEQQITKTKILANKFVLENRKQKIRFLDDPKYGTFKINDDNNLTIKVLKGNTVKVEFNESGY